LTSGVKIGGSTVTTADIEATNGVIHVIDTVLVPSSFTLVSAAPAPQTVDDSTTSQMVDSSMAPQTGDSSIILYAVLFLLSGTGILVVNRKRLFVK